MTQHYDVRWETGNDGRQTLKAANGEFLIVVRYVRGVFQFLIAAGRFTTGVLEVENMTAAKRAAITRLMASTEEL